MLIRPIPTNVNYEFASDVRAGLTRHGQKELLSKYLYDDVGTALFEVISHLPEYGLTRADERLLRRSDLEKPSAQLLEAYDDKLGVTAAFNLDLLARINRELDADFNLDHFTHVAKINQDARRVEMHIRSKRRHTVNIPAAKIAIEFRAGETIWTESSHKYSPEEISGMASDTGFSCQA